MVFNVGERVEGYTNFLWVMILSIPASLNLDYVSAAQILSVLLGVLIFPLTFLLAGEIISPNKEKFSESVFNILPLFLLSFNGGFHYWAVSGMETTLFSFLILFSIYLLFKSRNESNSVVYIYPLILASLTRPEGLLFFVLIFIARIFIVSQNFHSFKQVIISNKKDLIKELLVYTIPLLLYFIFRLVYYGYPFPNTYYAKTSYEFYYLIRGFNYLFESMSQSFIYGVMPVLPLIAFFRKNDSKQMRILIFIYVSYLAAIVIIGGDVLPFNRFILPVMPLIFIAFSKFLQSIIDEYSKNYKSVLQWSISGIFFLLLIGYSVRGYQSQLPKIIDRRDVEEGLVTKMKIYAEWVNEQIHKSGKQKTVALSTIGAFSYYSKAEVIDMIGLTDEYIAHNPVEIKGIAESVSVLWKERRYNAEYVLDSEPDYIIFPAGAKPSAFPESAIFSRERFIKNYYVQLIYSNKLNQYLPVFTKKDTLPTLLGSQYYDSCNLKFVGNYITANSELLRFIKDNKESRFQIIIAECKKMIEACPDMASEAYTTIGSAYYHKNDLDSAAVFLNKAIEENIMNSLPYVYLIDIMNKTNRKDDAVKYMIDLKKYSPDALPNIHFDTSPL